MVQRTRIADERRLLILGRLREHSVVRIKELADEFDTSQMTIRRDLDAMGAEGLLRRVHGGAVAAPRTKKAAVPSRDVAQIGILVPSADYYFGDIIQRCKQALAADGLPAAVISSNYDLHRERAVCEQFVEAGVDAIIYAPSFAPETSQEELTSWLFDLSVPVILLERELADPESGETLPSVRTAYEKGWELSLRRLRRLGHERVALVTHGLRQVGAHLPQTWERAAKDAGYGVNEAPLIRDERVTLSPPTEVLDEIITRIDAAGVTAIISHCDQATLGLAHALKAAGRRVPEDLSIITNEDQIAQLTEPPMSSSSPDKVALGWTVARLARDLVLDEMRSVQHVLIQPEFTDRGSCAPPPLTLAT